MRSIVETACILIIIFHQYRLFRHKDSINHTNIKHTTQTEYKYILHKSIKNIKSRRNSRGKILEYRIFYRVNTIV